MIYKEGVKYKHPRGAIGFVDLTKAVEGHANAGQRHSKKKKKGVRGAKPG